MTRRAVDMGPADWLISSAMMNDEALTHIRLNLDPDTLPMDTHRIILAACLAVQERGEPASFSSVLMQLKATPTSDPKWKAANQLEAIGGVPVVQSIDAAQSSSVPKLLDSWIAAVAADDTRRRVLAAADAMTSAARDHTVDAEALVESSLAQIAGVRERSERDTLTGRYTGYQAVAAFAAAWDADLRSDTGGRVGWPTALPKLGAATGGGQRYGWVVVSGARTGVGKTWFGLDCALQAHREGHRVAYFTLEMPTVELVERVSAMEGGGDLDAIQTRRADWGQVTNSLANLSDEGDRFVFLDGLTTPQRIRSELVGAAATGRPYRYLVIDTVNLVYVEGAENYRLGLNGLLRDLKALAVHHQCVIHLQAQLKRDDLRADDAPRLTDLRESSAMEQTGDVVLLVHRPLAADGNFAMNGELVLAKARSSARKGALPVRFDGFRFVQGHGFLAGAGVVA